MMLAGEQRDEIAIQAALRDRAPNAPRLEAAPVEARIEEAAGLSNVPSPADAAAPAKPRPSLLYDAEAISS